MRVFLTALALTALQPDWRVASSQYLDAYRAFFSGLGDTSVEASTRLTSLAEETRRAVPAKGELQAALSADDPRTRAVATAAVAMSEHPAPALLDVLLRRYARERDAILRRLTLDAFSAANGGWLGDRSAELAGVVATEKDPGVATIVILGLIPRLRPADALAAAAGIATQCGPETRKVLYASLDLRDGAPALRELADELRRRGEPELAAEAETHARASPCNRAKGLAIAEERATRAGLSAPDRAHSIGGPHDWREFAASQPSVAGKLDAPAVKALTRASFFAVVLTGTSREATERRGAYRVFLDGSTCQVLYSGWEK